MTRKEIFAKYFNKLRLELIAKYDELELRASGEYARELEVVISQDSVKMLSAVQAAFMENGISPSGHPYGPVRAIERWIETKDSLPPIFKEKKDTLKFAIARKIANEGIRVPNENNRGKVVSEVIDGFIENDLPEMLNEIGVVFTTRFASDIRNILKQAA